MGSIVSSIASIVRSVVSGGGGGAAIPNGVFTLDDGTTTIMLDDNTTYITLDS